MDHYSVHKITVTSAEELPFAIATPENGRNEECWIEVGPWGKARRKVLIFRGPWSQCRDWLPCPSNKYLIITGDKHHFWLLVWEKISPKAPYLIISKVVVASASLAIFRPVEDEVFWFKQELIEGSHMACVIHVTPDDPNSPFLAL